MGQKDDPRLDLLLGRVALERRLISEAQLREALAERALSVSRGRKVPRPVGAILAARHWLTDAQVADLVRELEARVAREEESRRKDGFLGQILIDADLVAPGHVEACLFDQAERWKEGEDPLPRLGDLLVLKGYATREDVEQALALQRSMTRTCAACRRECSLSEDVASCPVCGGAFKPRADATANPEQPSPKTVRIPQAADLSTIGRYKVRATLEKRPEAVVYDAHDVSLNRRVELGVVHWNRPAAAERARAAAALKHPHLAPVFEAGTHEGRFFVALERVDGRLLSDLKKAGPVKARQQIRALRDVALALDHAHRHGVVHRDLSPQSVRIDGQGRAVLVDLWAAAAESPPHMSPERGRGDREIGPAADLWSLGVLLYEALAGAPPFLGETPESTLSKVMCESPRTPSEAAPSTAGRAVFRPLETLCLRMLEKKPARRPASAKAVADELSAWLKGEAAAAAAPRARKAEARRWIPWAAGIVLALAGLMAGIGLATAESRAERILRKAGEYLAAEQPDAALQLYERVLEREPGNAAAKAGRDAARARLDAAAAREELAEIKAELERLKASGLAESDRRRLEERARAAERRARP